jgi:hypothetical protein
MLFENLTWEFANVIRGLDVAKTLHWEAPITGRDKMYIGAGALMLAYKACVLLPFFAVVAQLMKKRKRTGEDA